MYERAEALARRFAVPNIFTDTATMLDAVTPDFLDIVSSVATHGPLVQLAAERKMPVICQKPLAETLAEAESLVMSCHTAGIPLLIHENWRWQTPIRAVRNLLQSGVIGQPFRARMEMLSGFDLFTNQPALKTLKRFILADLGVHLLDTARMLFGEAKTVYCTTRRVHDDLQGEDVATVVLTMGDSPHPLTFLCQMAYARNYVERERFPETFLFIEGENGSIELGPDYIVRVTTGEGTLLRRYPPPRYAWADPKYDVVQASMVPCLTNLLAHLQGTGTAETTGDDNLHTLRLIEACYLSAAEGTVIPV
jgi:predicted dehydrogenase